MKRPARHLFEAYGVELEYMIVDADSLDVRPITDRVMHDVAGAYVSEHELGDIAWSNELALHVIELKTNGPAASLAELPRLFSEHVRRINELLAPRVACLMPTAMHPWMDPATEMKLWPHEYSAVYEAFNRVFDCRGHGWANLQSVHLNLPFAGDEEFGRLHAAIRLVLPLLPALAASSPFVDRKPSGMLDTRLDVYRANARRVPSVSGGVVPEPVFTRADYEQQILARLYRDIAPHDPGGVLQHEWLNARGAIARFDRNTIEIRVLDVQECPAADLAICAAIVAVLRGLVDERWSGFGDQRAFSSRTLIEVLLATIRDAEQAVIHDRDYLGLLGINLGGEIAVAEVWRQLVSAVSADEYAEVWSEPIEVILTQGTLARRMLRALPAAPDSEHLATLYRELCGCLNEGRMFKKGTDASIEWNG